MGLEVFKNIFRVVLIILILSPQFLTAQNRDDDLDRDSHKRRSYNWKWNCDWNNQERPPSNSTTALVNINTKISEPITQM